MSLDQAEQLYEDFRGFKPRQTVQYSLPDAPIFGVDVGLIDGLQYTTKRDGAPSKYFHEFVGKAKPRLVVSSDGKTIFGVEGDFEFTEEGFKDMVVPMVVANPRKREGKKMAKKTKKRQYRKAAAPAKTVVVHTNPAPRKKRRKTAAAKAPVKIVYRNPSRRGGKMGLNFKGIVVPAVMEAGGAVSVSVATALTGKMLNMPALTTGPLGAAVKMGFGLVGGLGLSMLSKTAGEAFFRGAIVVSLIDLTKNAISATVPMAGFVPSPGLNGFVPSPGLNGMIQDDDGTWYMTADNDDNMGAYTASMVAPDQDGPWNIGLNRWVNN